MQLFEFKSFPYSKLENQPLNSNWCWASCFINFLKICNINLDITACSLAKNYVLFNNEALTISSLEGCCNSENDSPSNICDTPIDVDDLEIFFSSQGLKCKKYDKEIDSLFEGDTVKNYLEEFKRPIILEVYNGNSHLVLITGYGYYGSCRYTLFSNPLESLNDEYVKNSSLENHPRYKPVRAWICTSIFERDIKIAITKDQVFRNNLNKINKILTREFKEIVSEKEILPLIFTSSSLHSILENDRNVRPKYLDKDNLLIAIRKELYTCGDGYLRSNTNHVPIRKIQNSIKDGNNKIEIPPSFKDYYVEFATNIERRLNNKNEHEVKPVNFPLNYNFKDEWITEVEFQALLLKKSKIKFFKH